MLMAKMSSLGKNSIGGDVTGWLMGSENEEIKENQQQVGGERTPPEFLSKNIHDSESDVSRKLLLRVTARRCCTIENVRSSRLPHHAREQLLAISSFR